MGYTNYWNQFRDFTTEEWDTIKDQCNYVHEVMPQIIVTHNNSETGCYISINGVGEEGHETFLLQKKLDVAPNDPRPYKFNFCKTAEKPYDLAVWYLLTWIYHNTDNAIAISRDRVGETTMRSPFDGFSRTKDDLKRTLHE